MKVKEVQRKMQELQEKYQIGLVAVTYQGICSCCAEPENFPKEWFLNKQQPATWEEVGSRILLKMHTMVVANWKWMKNTQKKNNM